DQNAHASAGEYRAVRCSVTTVIADIEGSVDAIPAPFVRLVGMVSGKQRREEHPLALGTGSAPGRDLRREGSPGRFGAHAGPATGDLMPRLRVPHCHQLGDHGVAQGAPMDLLVPEPLVQAVPTEQLA